ncbi:hypothetical protein BTJ68_11060 [Hortaea werneckii EXF-2000]|uniref:Uncharacterized protein n=2 Tax=Hortaea werneckii TaxID=91943 RepID=A0A3M7I7I2_HORWE|nr:hypothetical protein BTJ68_11060 [Hortaea werneckii EXF-2000]RMZ21421.1 hypothetical protein D0859_14564 [Hortaea werneckii]
MTFPVVVTAPVNAELINDFLKEAYKFLEEGGLPSLTILTTRDWSSYQPSQGKDLPYDEPPWTLEFNSPFLGMTPLKVASLLREEATFPPFKQELSDGDKVVSTEYCAILDNQTLSDGETALLVRTRRVPGPGENLPSGLDHSPIVQCRMKWEDVEQSLLAWSIGAGSMEETVWNNNC